MPWGQKAQGPTESGFPCPSCFSGSPLREKNVRNALRGKVGACELGSCVNVSALQLRKSRNYIANYQTHKIP